MLVKRPNEGDSRWELLSDCLGYMTEGVGGEAAWGGMDQAVHGAETDWEASTKMLKLLKLLDTNGSRC